MVSERQSSIVGIHWLTPSPSDKSAFCVAAAAGLILIDFHLIALELANIITPFLVFPMLLGVWVSFLGTLIFTLGYFPYRARQSSLWAIAPLAVHLMALAIIFFVPLNALLARVEFYVLLRPRAHVITQVEQGEFVPNVAHNESLIQLPPLYRPLSRGGGEIVVEHDGATLVVFFFTYRGVLDDYTGILYRSDEQPPSPANFGGDPDNKIVKLRDHWYWVVS